jgi:uncharacterized protein (DUF58 family)
MIAPRLRLILLMAFVAVPMATAAGLNRGFFPVSFLLTGFALVTALYDVALGLGRYRTLQFSLPDTLRGIRGERVELELRAQFSLQRDDTLRLAIRFPEGLVPEYEQIIVPLNKAASEQNIRIPFVGTSRGVFQLESLFFDWCSPFGFWMHRDQRSFQCQVRIYPNLKTEGKQIARFLNRGAIGIHAQPQIGKGREFEKLREYERGDSFDEINWKATAKRRFPVTKVFQLERSKEVYLALDTSRLSSRQLPEIYTLKDSLPTATTHLDRAISAALLFCVAAQRQGDRFGLVSFSDKVNHLVKARAGPAHFNVCRDLAVSLLPDTVSPDFADIAATLKQRIKRRSLFVFLTSLDDPVAAEDFVSAVELLSRQHLIVAVMIAPPVVQPLFGKETIEVPEELYGKLAGHLSWVKLQNLQRVLARKGVEFHVVSNQQLGLRLVSYYMDLKRRQTL